ncbi:MAG: immunoglobulin domain-containing protein, partial [Bacteroidales bacterium]
MKRLILVIFTFFAISAFAQEGTKQLMPNSNDRLYIEFNVFAGNNFGLFNSSEEERINIYLNAGERMHLGFKMNRNNYGGNVATDPYWVRFQVKDPNGNVVYGPAWLDEFEDDGYIINNYTEAVTGPNGAILNGSEITGGYNPLIIDAALTGNYYIEFEEYYDRRFALEYFDVTVTDNANNVITNPGEPNKSAGRLWSYAWQLSNTSFTEYPVNAHFFVFTEDEFVNKVNFKMYPYSFIFLANHFGVTTYTEENYIRRTQSQEGDQTGGEDVAEYRIFLNDPDRSVWPNTLLAPPKVQVWAEEELFMDYNYSRNPLYEDLDYSAVVLEKNTPACPHEDVTFFKIEANMDGFTAILIDINGDGEYSTGGSDRVIYRELKKGLNYILWDFKTDAGAQVANGSYSASATFFGRGPAHFPMYDVEQLDGITTSAIRPFNKLNTTIYWDDTNITNWGDMNGGDLMDETQQKQLKVEEHVPRTWMYRGDWANTPHNGEVNTMNTWFNAIDLGYGDIGIVVQESDTKCVDGSAPYVGDVYLEGPKDQDIVFDVEDFDYKFFHPNDLALSSMEILSLPSEGTLYNSGVPVAVGDEIARTNIGNLTYTPPTADYHGQTSFEWRGRDTNGKWSNNQENVYLIINTPPTISAIDDQILCTNTDTDEIEFTVGDDETPANELVVTGFSANPDFVPHTGINIGGSGQTRNVTVSPVANKSGRAIIYIMVDDGLTQVIEQFAVTVSPSLEFSGDTIVCEGDNLFLMAEEAGADSYEWSYDGTVVSTNRILEQAAPVSVGKWTLTITKTIDEGKDVLCTSTREFEVEVAPLTTFSGDTDVCVGEAISLTATEVNASYIWEKDGSQIGTGRTYSKSSASMSDAGTNYTLYVDKAGCQNTSDPFTITVKDQPNLGLSVTGSTVDPDKNATITIGQAQNNVIYNVYNESGFVTSGEGQGADIAITIDASYLEIGENEFTIKADNDNCEVELNQKAVIYVNQPGVTVSPLTLATQEDGGPETFEIVLDTEPTGDVTINIESNDTSEGTVTPSSVTFTPANWSTPQEVQVISVEDHTVDGDQPYTIEISLSNGNSYYNINPDNVTVTNIDTDEAGVTVTPTSLTTSEDGDT